MSLPDNLSSLHAQEEFLRSKALEFLALDHRLALHIVAVEQAMNLCDLLRKVPIDEEDFKVVQVLGMRLFNALGASLKLALSGYTQNSALVMRDILETVFLIDLFQSDRTQIARWRLADRKTLKQEFSLIAIREVLDKRDGFTTKGRHELYKLFSELAGHPTIKSDWMMRPQKNGDAVIGPFMEKTSLEAVISEMGRLALQVGLHVGAFFPIAWEQAILPRLGFVEMSKQWLSVFYPQGSSKATGDSESQL